MANQPDPTRRLRLLASRAGTGRAGDGQQPHRGAHQAGQDMEPTERLPVLRIETAPAPAVGPADTYPATGWVPDWAADPHGDVGTFHGDGTFDGDGTSGHDTFNGDDTFNGYGTPEEVDTFNGYGTFDEIDTFDGGGASDGVDTFDEDTEPDEPDLPDELDGIGAHELPPEPRKRLPRPRWSRLRDRWVPEPLREVRIDPGRRGSILLSLIAATAAVVAAIGVWTETPGSQPLQPVSISSPTVDRSTMTPTTGATAAAPTTMVVAVTGSVHSPGVFTLAAGSRVADAITAAGGMLDGVDYTGLNLAAKLADGDSIVVGGATQGLQSTSVPANQPGGASHLVNLNTADQATLETLPGVGPVMASNMLAWRTANGPFTTVDQLQEITGIGPARFATLAPLVTI